MWFFNKNAPIKRKLFINYISAFLFFSIATYMFLYVRDKSQQKEALTDTLRLLATVIHAEKTNYSSYDVNWETVVKHSGENAFSELRVTIIDNDGEVIYDNYTDAHLMESHHDREEILEAAKRGEGGSYRFSTTLEKECFYFTKKYQDYYVRTSLPVGNTLTNTLKTDLIFFVVLAILFLFFLFFILYNIDKVSHSIALLKNFALKAANREISNYETSDFPRDELGVIGSQIISMYTSLDKAERALSLERQKLNNWFEYSKRGVAIFDEQRTCIYVNQHFIQFLHLLNPKKVHDVASVFETKELSEVTTFINEQLKRIDIAPEVAKTFQRFEHLLHVQGRYLEITVMVYSDKSIEITLTDITKSQKNKKLKQQMTANISHELKTPVTAIRGYLETIEQQEQLDEEKKTYFIRRAYQQVMRLTMLIDDITIISKMEEAPQLYERKPLFLKETITHVINDLEMMLSQSEMRVKVKVSDTTCVCGNANLLYAIFRNLFDNAIKYAGVGSTIRIEEYHTDNTHIHLTFSDSGKGVDAEEFSSIFNRFYRVDDGRTRKQGGTGLGLAIVKNAILFHKGEIKAKKAAQGGLEFLFSLERYLS